jgi:hypothetical protein
MKHILKIMARKPVEPTQARFDSYRNGCEDGEVSERFRCAQILVELLGEDGCACITCDAFRLALGMIENGYQPKYKGATDADIS